MKFVSRRPPDFETACFRGSFEGVSRYVSRYVCSLVRTLTGMSHVVRTQGTYFRLFRLTFPHSRYVHDMFHDMFVHLSGLRRAQGTPYASQHFATFFATWYTF